MKKLMPPSFTIIFTTILRTLQSCVLPEKKVKRRPPRSSGLHWLVILAVLLAFSSLLSTAMVVGAQESDPPPTETVAPPPDTPIPPPPTDTPAPPPTDTPIPPPTDTPVPPPTDTPAPPPTDTPAPPPTDTPPPPTDTPAPPPTDTPIPLADTPTLEAPTDTPVAPTDTPVPATDTPVPTDTPIPTDTPTPTSPPTLKSDLPDYNPGQLVTITGTNWQPDETVHIFVNDDEGQSWSHEADITAATDGKITDQFYLPNWFVATYTATAKGSSGATITITFTDANDTNIGTYDQCSNDTGTGYTTGDTGCRWINGNLQSNNSRYFEGDATVQRLWLTDLPTNSTHTITFKYGTTKGGKHAYDFLTTWNWSENWITLNDRCQGITGCTTAAQTTLDIPQDPNVPNSFEPSNPGDRQFVMRGGTLSNATTPTIVSGDYTGDSETAITITFTVPSSGSMCATKSGVTTCSVAIWFGAHVAAQANWGLGLGAGSISGSPYHVALDAVDGNAIGQRDNQMQANVVSVVPNGTIVIVKDAVPNDIQDFGFNLNNNSTISQNFSLDDDSDTTLPNSQAYSVPPGTWYASELGLPITGWDLPNLICTVTGANGSSATVDLTNAKATITLKSSDIVTCTFTNTKRGTIIINKTTTGGDATFAYTTTGGNGFPTNFNITTSSGTGSQTYTNIKPGSYSVAETPIAGWTLTSSSCSSGTPGSFTVPPGGTVTCTFNNTRTYNKDLTVTKTATASFSRLYKWLIDKSVDKTQINIAEGDKATFNYSVKVTPNGYEDSSWTVSGKITVANSNAFAISGVNVTDTINNGGNCTVTGGTNVTVTANGNVVLDYSCSYTAVPSPAADTNTATATWSKTTYDTPNGSASGTAGVDFSTVTPSTTNKTITVVDDKTTDTPVTLGTWDWADGEHIFTYSLDKSGVAGKCTDYTNTAKISETGQVDSQKITVCVGQDLTVSKTATAAFNRTFTWDISKEVDKTQVSIAEGGTATFNYTVNVTHSSQDSDWTVSGQITVSNPNDWEAITANVSDAIDNGGVCTVTGGTNVSIPASGSKVLDYSCTYASAPSLATGTNTVTVTWDKATYFTPTDTALGTAGVNFSTVTPSLTDDSVDVFDTNAITTLNPTGYLGTLDSTDPSPTIYEYAVERNGMAGTCTDYDNTATFTTGGDNPSQTGSASQTVTVCVGKDLTVSKTASGAFDRTYLWKISKDVDQTKVNIADGGSYTFQYNVIAEQTGITDSGWTLSGKITITNPNDWEAITLTGLSDAVDNGGACIVDPGPYVVPKSGSLDVNYSCSYASAPTSYSGTNTATATWGEAAAHTPSGSASGSKDFTLSQLGSTNKTVHVTDSYGGNLGTVTATDEEPFATGTFTYDRTESGVAGKCTTYDNTATITETDQSASKEVTLCVGADLTVTKTAAGTFDRTYKWLIDKSVEDTRIEIAKGGTATFNYTVNVTPDGYTDGGWTMGGTITVHNPNDWEGITADVADSFAGGGVCTVTDGEDVVIPAGESVTLNYSCAFSGQPTYTDKNTATVTWDKDTFFTSSGSASGEVDVTLTLKGETNRTITVMDDKTTGTPVKLGASDYYAGPFQYTYSLDKQGVAGTCTDYPNTATIDETGQSDSQTVTVCVGADLTVEKTVDASKTRTYKWKIDKSVEDTRIEIAEGGTTTFNYTVKVVPDGFTDSDFTLSGTITVHNPNNWEDITLTGLSDTLDQGGTCWITESAPYVVPKSGSLTVPYTCTTNGTTTTNTATATWDKVAYFTPDGSASGDAGVTFAITSEVNKTITVVDDQTDPANPVMLGQVKWFLSPVEFTYSLDKQGVAGTCTDYTNTAKISETGQSDSQTVTVCVGKDLTVSKTASGTFDRTYLWKISKDVDQTEVKIADGSSYTFNYTVNVNQTGISDSGWTLSGKITLTNPNDWEAITLTSLSDVANGGSCTLDPGPYVVPKSSSLEVNYTCTWVSAPPSYSGTFTATANWDEATYFTPSGMASSSVPYTLTQLGSTNKTVNVTDSYAGDLGTVTATDEEPFATGTFIYDRTESGVAGTCTTYDNTAKIKETGLTTPKVIVELCVAKDLTVSKTAKPTFTRTFNWDVTKDVDKTLVRQNSGSVDFNYTVVANQTGFTDSDWKVVGTITVNNPNEWEDITVDITDAVNNGGTCTVAGGTNVSVPASSSVTKDYTCTYASAPSSYSGTNTGKATWDKGAVYTPNGSATGTQAFAFDTGTAGNPTNVNKIVTVTDTFNGGLPTTLGTLTGTTSAPYTTATYTYKRTINIPDAACKSYTNTAKILSGTTVLDSDSETVTVCKPSLVTNSSLCSLPNNQFKLVYTPDQTPANGWKLNASNPGQFYYNVFYTGSGDEDITITLPYPFVTQGAVPIHVYSNVGVVTTNGTTCLTPNGELSNESDQVTLANYSPNTPPTGFGQTTTVTIHVPAVSGFAYINIHLDYGLKGTTGYAKGGLSGNDAVAVNTSTMLIADLKNYTFSDSTGGNQLVQSINSFKKDPGIGGLVQKNGTSDPIVNAKVQIYDSSNKLMATAYTDDDGWYMWQYKWTGKAATFTVKMWPYSPYSAGLQSQTVTLKANGYLVVSFTVP